MVGVEPVGHEPVGAGVPQRLEGAALERPAARVAKVVRRAIVNMVALGLSGAVIQLKSASVSCQ